MGLSNYTDLQAAVAAELNRGDLSAQVPDFITRFEVKARRALKDWLRSTLTFTNVTADFALAATVSDVLSVSYNDGTNGAHNFALDLATKEIYQQFMESQSAPASTAGQLCYPDYDANTGLTTLRFWPPATSTGPIANLKVEVILVLQSLSVSVATNPLLRDAPDAYLNGACAEAEKYLQHDERVQMWKDDRDAALRELRIQTERRLYGGAPRRKVLPYVFG